LNEFPVVCMLSFPSSLYSTAFSHSLYHLTHYSFILQPLSTPSPYAQYDALLTVHHIHQQHSLKPCYAEHPQYLVAIDNNSQLNIHKISLPPQQQNETTTETNQTENQQQQQKGHIAVEGNSTDQPLQKHQSLHMVHPANSLIDF